jgi:putative tryptophan/tyrosine transport system substrate-binding protein
MKRREFIAGLGGAAAWPLAARTQQPNIPVVGYLVAGGVPSAFSMDAFRKGLSEMGYVEGRNVTFEYRGTEHYDELPVLAAELVRRRVSVIFTGGGPASTLAAKAATATIPIVFQIGTDPIKIGLIASLNRPGGNVTGVSNFARLLVAKRLELLRELVPQASLVGYLAGPIAPESADINTDLQAAARSLGQEIVFLSAGTVEEIDSVFATVANRNLSALMVGGDGFFYPLIDRLVALAARYRIPASFAGREFVEGGGLMSYGDDRFETRRQAGIYVGRILNGERPADLPVQQPIKFELVINLKTAKALGLTIPETLLATADEVIQ